jgi:hypothetical protein
MRALPCSCSFLTAVYFAAGMAAAQDSVAQDAPADCDLSTITRPIHSPPSNRLIVPDSVQATFSIKPFATGPFTKDVVVPRIYVVSDMSKQIEDEKARTRAKIQQAMDGITVGNLWFGQTRISQNRLEVDGAFNVQKWWSMTGFCCTWFNCHRCEWKTIIFERSVAFTAFLDNLVPVTAPMAAISPGVFSGAAVNTGNSEKEVQILIKSSATPHDDRSFLEKVWGFVASIIDFIDHIFGGKEELDVGQYLGNNYGLDQTDPLEPQKILKDNLLDYGYDPQEVKDLHIKSYGNRDVWDAFSAGMFFSSDHTGFLNRANAPYYMIDYAFNRDRYLKVLDDTYSAHRRDPPKGDDREVTGDFLRKDFFCAKGRPLMEGYLDRVVKRFEGKDKQTGQMTTNANDAKGLLAQFYGTYGTEEYYRSEIVKAKRARSRNLSLQLISSVDLAGRQGVVPGLGSIDAIAREQDWTAEEKACAVTAATRRSGSPDRVFPLENFEGCTTSSLKLARVKTLGSQIERRYGDEIFTVANRLVGPIVGQASYRGWYYCTTFVTLCTGKHNVLWWQEPSKYGARGGAHVGMDLVSDPQSTAPEVQLQAVADGHLLYTHRDPDGWGHALLLPFASGNRKFIAVYAHLPKEAKELAGRNVHAGDPLGIAGCTGNAGNGTGRCNTTCDTGADTATDVHVHFELLELSAATLTPVDPTSVIPFAVKEGGLRRVYPCRGRSPVAQHGGRT